MKKLIKKLLRSDGYLAIAIKDGGYEIFCRTDNDNIDVLVEALVIASKKAVHSKEMFNSEQGVQASVATESDSKEEDDKQNKNLRGSIDPLCR